MDYIDLISFSTIWVWIVEMYYIPGNLLVSCLSNTDIGRFYEFSYADRDGVFSFFTPWFVIAILLSSIDDTKSGGIISLDRKNERILTKNGRSRTALLFISLFTLILSFLLLRSFNIQNSWINLMVVILSMFISWYTLFTNGYSFKRKKFRKTKQLLMKKGKGRIVKFLLWTMIGLALLVVLFLVFRFVAYSCSFVVSIIPILFIMLYFSIGNRWKINK